MSEIILQLDNPLNDEAFNLTLECSDDEIILRAYKDGFKDEQGDHCYQQTEWNIHPNHIKHTSRMLQLMASALDNYEVDFNK